MRRSDSVSVDWDRGRSPAAMIAKLGGFETVFFEYELPKAAEDISLKIEAEAKDRAPVDTGALRADISEATERVTSHTVKAIIGSSKTYAPIQEIQQPYLRPAIEAQKGYIKERVKQALDNAVDTVS